MLLVELGATKLPFVHQQRVLALQEQAELGRRRPLYAEDPILKVARKIQLHTRRRAMQVSQAFRP